jgi:1,4-dihydroxy-6-naphthoate synthase
MTLRIGFSPCPNDTFIFDALVNGKIDTGELRFEVVLEDVQTLNEWAAEGRLDITKLSFPALFENRETYAVLQSGAALGKGVGPLLVAKKMVDVRDMAKSRVAVPGLHTTANFLLSFAFPELLDRVPVLFSSIEEEVLEGRADLGVLIHENRFTYQQKGLHKICDLGAIWEERQQAPIPLGCIAVRRTLDNETQEKVDQLIRQSLEYAFARYPVLPNYVQEHAQAMELAVMRQHIGLYVNNFTLDLAEEGRRAIEQFYRVYRKLEATDPLPELFRQAR